MKVQSAKGVRDVPPEEKIVKNKVVDMLRSTFETFGFVPLESSIIQRYDTLSAKFAAGEDSDAMKETFKLTDQGQRKLALRFDLTVPLAAYVAQNPTMKLPFKRYEVGTVFRDGPIKLGRFRSFTQMDFDIVGTSSMLADAEIIAILEKGFKKLDLDVVIKVNNRKLLNGILEQSGIENKDEAIVAIDKLEKIGKDGVTKELLDRGYTKNQIDNVFSLISKGITIPELKEKITCEEGIEGLNELEELFNYLSKIDISLAQFDVSLARGLGYYTGTAFEVFLNDSKITSSIAAGGRYDKMIGGYLGGGRVIPAVGGSFGLAPIMEALKLRGDTNTKSTAKVLVIPIKTINESLSIVSQLRENDISCDFAITKKGVTKNLDYANSLKIPYVIIIGQKELDQEKVVLRNMESGEEKIISVKEVIEMLQ